MQDQDYERLVRRLEIEAQSAPRAFQAKVMLLSGFAYLILFAMLGVLAALVVAGFHFARESHSTWITFKLALLGVAVAGLLFGVLRAFLARLPEPEGREIGAAEAPRLFELIERIRRKLDGPPIHRVVVDPSFNAAIAQVPRFGLFGGHRNHLILGLPYLHAMTTKEMAATLAHEYGHLAGAHGKTGAWIYRQRITFGTLMDKLQRESDGDLLSGLLLAALVRFAPYFNAYTFVLSRQDEYDADAISARLAGAEAAATGLCRGALLGDWIAETFWSRLYAQAGERTAPAFMPYTAMPAAFAAGYPDWATAERLAEARRVRSGLHDTHPSLQDRLSAIDQPARVPPPVGKSAAETLLGPLAQQLAREFDTQWWQTEQAEWQAHHRQCLENRAMIARLQGAPHDALNAFDLHELGRALAREGRGEEARTVLTRLLARPDGPFPQAELLLGRLLLVEDDHGGLEHLHRAAAADARLVDECAQRGYDFLCRTRDADEASEWADTLVARHGV
ncbi:M48 family metallopeptidase [Pseudothauera rhizosphaerae]|nr:M48 family metallopeptidase [Pseudothauera rhizosphaerae]